MKRQLQIKISSRPNVHWVQYHDAVLRREIEISKNFHLRSNVGMASSEVCEKGLIQGLSKSYTICIVKKQFVKDKVKFVWREACEKWISDKWRINAINFEIIAKTSVLFVSSSNLKREFSDEFCWRLVNRKCNLLQMRYLFRN